MVQFRFSLAGIDMKALFLSCSTDAIAFWDNVYIYVYMFPPEKKAKAGTHMLKSDPRPRSFQPCYLPDSTAAVKPLMIPCYSAVFPIAPLR